jgi:D-alanyl-D-alanine carboxypeptidase
MKQLASALAVLLLSPLMVHAQTDTASRLARAFEVIERVAAKSNGPGMVIAITDRNRTLRIGAYGYADLKSQKAATSETLFEIGSVTKSFTAISLMELYDEGRFDPQKPVSSYVPWFAIQSKYRAITQGRAEGKETANIMAH